MLNPFPELLTYSFFAPMLLRVIVAGFFAYMTHTIYKHRSQAAHAHLPIVGVQPWTVPFTMVVYAAIALMLLVGYYTQIAALLGVAASLKELVWGTRIQALYPLSRTTAFLLLGICVALLLTGAGAYAVDLPL